MERSELTIRRKIINYVVHSEVKCVRTAAKYYFGLRGPASEWSEFDMKIDYYGFMRYVNNVYRACQGQFLAWDDYYDIIKLSNLVKELHSKTM